MNRIDFKQIVFLALLFIVGTKDVWGVKNKHFMIIIPSRNNSEWYERNLNSLRSQSYDNWHAIYINDVSTDDTGKKVEQFIKDHKLQDKIFLINNEERRGPLGNIVKAVYMCDDWDVTVTLDGDDWFKGPDVLQKLNAVYADDNVWMTYGSYEQFPVAKKSSFSKQIPVPASIIASNGYRHYSWCTSHLRTFYAWLFKCINLDDLKIDGEFFTMSGDLAHMILLIELSGTHSKHISDILYVYNLQTSQNEYKVNRSLQLKLEKAIRSRPPYQPLKMIPIQYLPRR